MFLPHIDVDSSATVEIEFLPQANLEQRPYAVTLQMAYEDEKGQVLDASETMAIPVYQEARAEVGSIEVLPQEVTVGNQVNLMFSVINKGKNKLYNVNVEASEEGASLDIPQHYVGNIEAGSQMQVDLMATAMAPLFDTQEIKVTYEDELGHVSELTGELDQLSIVEFEEPPMDPFEEEPFEPMEDPEMEEPERGPFESLETWQYVAIGVGAVAIIGVIVGVRKRRKRRKQEIKDLGLDDEL